MKLDGRDEWIHVSGPINDIDPHHEDPYLGPEETVECGIPGSDPLLNPRNSTVGIRLLKLKTVFRPEKGMRE